MHRVLLASIAVGALLLRVVGLWSTVFAGSLTRFMANDPYYHVRQIQQLVRHFPHRMTHDPYASYPDGSRVVVGPFMDFLVAFAAWLVGFGDPSPDTVDMVAALSCPVFGALTCVVVYLIGKQLEGPATGLLAAFLVAVLPGQFMNRSMLGFVDHHALETLLSTLAMYGVIRAQKAFREHAATTPAAGWEIPLGPAAFALLGGLALGCYLLTWTGGALVVLILLGWSVVHVNVNHLRGVPSRDVAVTGAIVFGIALLLVLPFETRGRPFQWKALGGALTAVLLFPALSTYLRSWKAQRIHLPAATLAFGSIAVLALHLFFPVELRSGLNALSWFVAKGTQLTVTEAEPLLMPQGKFSFVRAWAHFGITLPAALLGLVVVGRRLFREGRSEDTLLIVWSVAMLLVTLGQNRFEYYSVVNVSLLTALLAAPPLVALAKRSTDWTLRGLPAAGVLLALVIPIAERTYRLSTFHPGPHDYWTETLEWMRTRTPEPFRDPAYFEARYAERKEDRPKPEYGIMCWWDVGYWVMQLGRRIPIANPTQRGAQIAAGFFTAQDERVAAAIMKQRGLRYVLVDSKMPVLDWGGGEVAGFITEMRAWTGLAKDDLLGIYTVRQKDGSYEEITFFHEEYYRTMCVRMFLYGGRGVTPVDGSLVIQWRDRVVEGQRVKEVFAIEEFERYEQAKAALDRVLERNPNARIVGDKPVVPCVPIEPLRFFQEVHHSDQVALPDIGGRTVHHVQVWEYKPRR